jgi:hypothetical protein
MARARTVTGVGVLATAVLVLVFGNQAFTEWVDRHHSRDNVWGWFLHTLAWPAWAFGPDDDSKAAMRRLLSNDLRALLLVLFVAVILGVAARTVTGGAGAFILGWAALIFASALAAFLTAFILSNPSLLGAFRAAEAASAYGLFVGWIVGAAVTTARSA